MQKQKYDFTKEKEMTVFAEGDEIRLCKFREEDRSSFIQLHRQNAMHPSAFKMPGFEDILWEAVSDEEAFYVAIRRKSDNIFMGYCAIENTKKEELELTIELLKEFQSFGYGKKALTLFMNKIKEYAGVNSFITLVDGENIAGQKLCEACGGIPSGIKEHLLYDNDYMEEYERDNQDEITDQIRKFANIFSVPPEMLLTHVLVYRFMV